VQLAPQSEVQEACRRIAYPVLVDFEQSIFNRADYSENDTAILPSGVRFAGAFRTHTNRSFRDQLRATVLGTNHLATEKSFAVLQALKSRAENPRLLIIGGGSLGAGVDTFYQDEAVKIVSTDVYPSPYTCLLADAHFLPFRNEVFDGVWITSVLEHVLEPHAVVEQIYRVLKPGGLVYAETPFMIYSKPQVSWDRHSRSVGRSQRHPER
jgi:SAM-dependent methyltransferase